MNHYEKIFIILARILGITLFKKYWPVRGSFWNKTHISRTDRDDLECIIKEADNFTKEHIIGLTQQLVITFVVIMTGDDNTRSTLKLMLGLTLMHLYAFMAHHYNRILAREALALLSDKPDSIIRPIGISRQPVGWFVDKSWTNDGYYVSFASKVIGPTFVSEHDAEKFKDYLISRYHSRQEVFDAIYLGKVKQDFIHWSEKRME